MAIAIKDTLKEVGFTEEQARILAPVFEKAKEDPPFFTDKNLGLEVGEIKGRITMLAWTVGILAAVFIGVSTLLYQRTSSVEASLNRRITSVEASLNQRITSVETSLNQRIDDIKEDISENQAMIAENRDLIAENRDLIAKNNAILQRVLEKLDNLEDQIKSRSR